MRWESFSVAPRIFTDIFSNQATRPVFRGWPAVADQVPSIHRFLKVYTFEDSQPKAGTNETTADFRKSNGQAIRHISRNYIHFGKQASLFGGALVARDGSKFKASNSRGRIFPRAKLKDFLMGIDEKPAPWSNATKAG
jgi:hypothetical protein